MGSRSKRDTGFARSRVGSLLLAVGCAASAVQFVAAQDGVNPTPEARDLSSVLPSIIESRHLPALAVAVVRDGQIVGRGAAGVRRAGSLEPVTTDDLWHIGSCTKAMTATLAARLVEAGKIKWDTTIDESLGAVDGLGAQILPAYRPVTLRQLLSHRSGLPEDRAPEPAIWGKVWSLKGPMIEQRRAVASIVLSREPASAPGSMMAYSNFGYVVAAAMMEQATGKTWEELMRQQVFEPLGMHSAGFGPPSADNANHEQAQQPWGHRTLRDGLSAVKPWTRGADNPPVHWPAGGIHVTLADWAKFAAAQLKGERGQETTFLTTESWKVLHEDAYHQDYALGWVTGTRPWAAGQILTHSGSNGMWMAVIWLAPKRDLAIMAATNAATDGAAPGCDEAVVAALRSMGLLESDP